MAAADQVQAASVRRAAAARRRRPDVRRRRAEEGHWCDGKTRVRVRLPTPITLSVHGVPCFEMLLRRWTSVHRRQLPAGFFLSSTLCPEKGSHLLFDNNFGKCGPIFKILQQLICAKILYVYTCKDFHFTCDMLLHYLVKVENPKMLLILTASSTNC